MVSKRIDFFDDLLKIMATKQVCCCQLVIVVVVYSVRMSSLREQLIADGEYFKYMLNMIPGGYCVDHVQNTASETHSSRNTGGM